MNNKNEKKEKSNRCENDKWLSFLGSFEETIRTRLLPSQSARLAVTKTSLIHVRGCVFSIPHTHSPLSPSPIRKKTRAMPVKTITSQTDYQSILSAAGATKLVNGLLNISLCRTSLTI